MILWKKDFCLFIPRVKNFGAIFLNGFSRVSKSKQSESGGVEIKIQNFESLWNNLEKKIIKLFKGKKFEFITVKNGEKF